MRDTYDPRWNDDRHDAALDGRDVSRGSRGATDPRETEHVSARDVFSRGLRLPRGLERTGVRARDRTYELRGSETRTLSTVGAFRVVRASDLRDHLDRPGDPRQGELRRLRESGLIRTTPLDGHRDHVVVLTDGGRELLEGHRDRSYEPRQTFYAGVRKPRELEHDSQLYRAYLRASAALEARTARIDRVQLDYELKQEYQRFLQERNRDDAESDGRPDRERWEIENWAREHELPYFDDQVHFPDVRIEYHERDDPRTRYEDIEVTTIHYRGAHGAAAARSGFSCYCATSARVGGRSGRGGRGRPFDPDFAARLL